MIAAIACIAVDDRFVMAMWAESMIVHNGVMAKVNIGDGVLDARASGSANLLVTVAA